MLEFIFIYTGVDKVRDPLDLATSAFLPHAHTALRLFAWSGLMHQRRLIHPASDEALFARRSYAVRPLSPSGFTVRFHFRFFVFAHLPSTALRAASLRSSVRKLMLLWPRLSPSTISIGQEESANFAGRSSLIRATLLLMTSMAIYWCGRDVSISPLPR